MLVISSWPGLNSGGVGFYLTCALDARGRIIPRDPWGKVATSMGIDEWRRYNEQTWKRVQQTFTWTFSPILSGFELFGMTETPSSTRNLSRTWAGDLLYRFDTSSTVGWEMRFGISFLQKNIVCYKIESIQITSIYQTGAERLLKISWVRNISELSIQSSIRGNWGKLSATGEKLERGANSL